MSWIIQSLIASYPPPSSVWSGLVAYYKLDSNSNDSVGSNNGTDTNVSYVTGKIGNMASLSNGSISIPNISSWYKWLFTINVWVDPVAIANSPRIFWLSSHTVWWDSQWDYQELYVDTSWNIKYRETGSNHWDTTLTTSWATLSNWTLTMVTLVKETTTTARVYINWVSRWTQTYSSSWSTDSAVTWWFWTIPFSGTTYYTTIKLDEWSIWNRAITASEVTTLYNSGSGITY